MLIFVKIICYNNLTPLKILYYSLFVMKVDAEKSHGKDIDFALFCSSLCHEPLCNDCFISKKRTNCEIWQEFWFKVIIRSNFEP